jgi:RNA polymerase sigma-70 factor, ECF subfamily
MAYWTEPGSLSERKNNDQVFNEETLVIRAQQGSQQAFEMLYARYNEQINRYVSRMIGDNQAGSEITQEIFLKAWSGLPGLRTSTLFTSWLYRIALNCTRDYQKRQRRMTQIPLDECSEGDALSVAGPEARVEDRELLQIALAHVSPTYRACLILYVIEELSQRQIAERLNIKETSVGKYVSRGKEELRQVYQRLLGGKSSIVVKRKKGKVDE